MKILVEGPDKCGKTTLVKAMSEELGYTPVHLPAGWYRQKLLSSEVKHTAAAFLFFAETMELWESAPRDVVIDRDILSMIVYQGLLLKVMEPMIILNLYKSVIYKHDCPDKLLYLVNEPFEAYDVDDKFEAFGYEIIRTAYEEAFRLVKFNFPEMECNRFLVEEVK